MRMTYSTAHEAARSALAAGLSTIPPMMDGSKKPIGEWAQYQQKAPSSQDIDRWYSNGQTGVGLVCGNVSGNLECLDFDTHDVWKQYKKAARSAGLHGLLVRVTKGYAETTPNGFHLLYRCDAVGGNAKLAQTPDETKPNKIKTLIETRGKGGFIIVAPSSGKVNDDGDYVLKAGGFDSIETITPEELLQLHTLAQTFDEVQREEHKPQQQQQADGGRPGDDFERSTTWEQVLEPHGWTKVFQKGETTHWRRPGKEKGESATTNINGSDFLYVFSTSTVFDSERGYNRFSAYTLLNHSGDFTAAVRELGRRGYGSRTQGNHEGKQGAGKAEAPPPGVEAQSHTYGARDSGNSPIFNETEFTDLLSTDFPPINWNIQDILPSGTMLLSAKPKKGKSYLAIMIGIAIAAGREVFGKSTNGGSVLYLGLEDSNRRLRQRGISSAKVLGLHPADYAHNLATATTCNSIDTGLIQQLADRMKRKSDTTLIIVDMLKKVTAERPVKDLYKEQARVGDTLTQFCHEYPHLSILVVHHSRKAESDDPFDLVSGTTGLVGSYDQLAVIVDEPDGGRTLHVTGRDIEGAEIPLLMSERGMYTLAMPTPEELAKHGMSSTRSKVYDAIPLDEWITRRDIILKCNLKETVIDQQLLKMRKEGLLMKRGRGEYQRSLLKFYDEPIFQP